MSDKCKCMKPPFFYLDFDSIDIGEDGLGEITIDSCKRCGIKWIKYLIEEPQLTKSGRWWRALIGKNEENKISVNTSKSYIENQGWCFIGGSYFDGEVHKKERPICIH